MLGKIKLPANAGWGIVGWWMPGSSAANGCINRKAIPGGVIDDANGVENMLARKATPKRHNMIVCRIKKGGWGTILLW